MSTWWFAILKHFQKFICQVSLEKVNKIVIDLTEDKDENCGGENHNDVMRFDVCTKSGITCV